MYHRRRRDQETGSSRWDGEEEEEDEGGPFDIIMTKNAAVERLKRWRQSALVLNRSRRFRYTLDLKNEEEKNQMIARIRRHAADIRAALQRKYVAEAGQAVESKPPIPEDGYGIDPKQLASLTRDHDFPALQLHGGARLAVMLKTNEEKGIEEEEADLSHRRNVFGSNTYPRKKGHGFWNIKLEITVKLLLYFYATVLEVPFGCFPRLYLDNLDGSRSCFFRTRHEDKERIFMYDESVPHSWEGLNRVHLAISCLVSSRFRNNMDLSVPSPRVRGENPGSAPACYLIPTATIATAISDYKQSLQFRSLNKVKQNIHLEVIRGGRRVEVSIFDIVVGDVVPLRIGNLVPADGILIFGHRISIDDSAITPENKLVHKNSRMPFLMGGCIVADGYGTMLVTSVGLNTRWGKLMATTLDDNGEETPLQVHLNGVATYVSIIGLGLAFVVLLVLMVRYFTWHTTNPDGSVQFRPSKTKIAESMDRAVKIFTVAVTIVIVAVPEGLPLAIILTLAYSTRNMIAEKALVLRLSACEIMGSATTICTHKTGILTSNLMTVVEVFICGEKIVSPNNRSLIPPAVTSLLMEGIAHNTTGCVSMPEPGKDTLVSGSPTEKAILQWGLDLGMNFDAVRSNSSVIHAYLFNPVEKRGDVVVNLMTSAGLCCIAFAFRSYQMESIPTDEEKLANWCLPEVDLVLLAIIGIKVRMVTGDNLQTARAIALEYGILRRDADATEPNIIEGRTFRALSKVERKKIAEKISIVDIRVIVENQLFNPGERIAIGASGGKYSTVLAYVMLEFNRPHNYGLDLFLFGLDLGAALLKVDKLVTRHNADDIAEIILINILLGDIPRLSRCTSITTGEDFRIAMSTKMPEQGKCEHCGYISSQKWCKACVLLEGLNRGLKLFPFELMDLVIVAIAENVVAAMRDQETGSSRWDGEEEEEEEEGNPFDITRNKSAAAERLIAWRRAALVLNRSRQFRYTLDFKKDEEKKQIIAKIRLHAEIIRLQSRKVVTVKGLADMLKTNEEKGIEEEEADLSHRRNVFGSNTYRRKKGHGFGRFLLDAFRDYTLIVLMVAAAASFALGMKTKDAYAIMASIINSMQSKGNQSTATVVLLGIERNHIQASKASKQATNKEENPGSGLGCYLIPTAAIATSASFALQSVKEGWYDGGSIALAVIISSVITAISDYKQSLQFRSLNKVKQNIHLEVIRGGRRVEVSIFDIVVGDVVPLRIGDLVPADGILIFGHCVSIDESSITGENKLVHKNSRTPFLRGGSIVADGYGTILVTSVGQNTQWGELMASTSDDNGEETPLQLEGKKPSAALQKMFCVLSLGLHAGVPLAITCELLLIGHTTYPDGSVQFIRGKTKIAESMDGAVKIFTVAVTIVIVAVPEGLPLAVILTLAYTTRNMIAEKALVLKLSACEIMGSATTICTHKTGILTSNLMTVVEVFICGEKIVSPNNRSLIPPAVTSLLMEGIAHNTTGSVSMPEDYHAYFKGAQSITKVNLLAKSFRLSLPKFWAFGLLLLFGRKYYDDPGKDTLVSGSPTEKAILQWGLDLGMNFDAVRSNSSVIHAYLFNPVEKRGGVVVNLVTLFKNAIQDMTSAGLCCIAFAFRSYQMESIPTDEEKLANWCLPEDGLVLLAIIGIKVRMVTGDNLQTARAIALECGILRRDADATEPNIIEGRTFRALSEAERKKIAEKISVMGRSSPHDKLLLVQALRKRGHVVAVTGAGFEDAPALHEADVSLAMGVQGTQVAKDHSDIIILDDNFVSVVKVVRWGRSIYANIQKFVQFQLTLNVAAVMISVLDAVFSGEVPYNAVQLLWVNMVMDTLGVLAMATERPQDNLMRRAPIRRREPLITNIIWRNLLIQALYQVTVLLVLNSRFKSMLNLEHDERVHAAKVKNTLIFNGFIFCQIFSEFNARKPDGINVLKGVTKNYFFIGIACLTILLQVIIITFLGKFTSSVRLNWKLWLISIFIGFISWPLVTIAKLIPVPKAAFSKFLKRNFLKLKKLTGSLSGVIFPAYQSGSSVFNSQRLNVLWGLSCNFITSENIRPELSQS
ncbi:hypothetical protein LguiB_021343 [Lonicera macranthoides]